jgi:hypothetical protein
MDADSRLRSRPIAVTLLAFANIWVGAGVLLFALVAGTRVVVIMAETFVKLTAPSVGLGFLQSVGSTPLVVVYLIAALIQGAIGVGLWYMREWARRVGAVYFACAAVGFGLWIALLLVRFPALPGDKFIILGIAVGSTVFAAIVAWYLSSKDSRQRFACQNGIVSN